MTSQTSYLSTQHWIKQDPADEEDDEISPTEEEDGGEEGEPSFTSQLSCKPHPNGLLITELDENRDLWPETGRPGSDITSYIISVISYDPATKKLSRETKTANRPLENYEVQDFLDAIGPANQMDDSIRFRLGESERDKDGWLATCFKEENADALKSSKRSFLRN
ncbi:hypothetical protein I350_04434 [Cryptococcus amylolentus CBS 6273]|uniref:Uncharacterized protein n=1 Tax=Cryptococcus amylolentus CBS 6273 TaxID=1296118 RepID=A0A1E3K1Z7_9TREE|nr:hypothetical protein I350_04434 [Cryptococcus amylolentus CBS 6273]